MSTTKVHVCDNCGREWKFHKLAPIKDLSSRVEPGGIVPSGECPECHALCYPEGCDKYKDALSDIFDILFYDGETEKFDPNKEWDVETLEAVAEIVRAMAPDFAGQQAKEFEE